MSDEHLLEGNGNPYPYYRKNREKLMSHVELIKLTNVFFQHDQSELESQVAVMSWSWNPDITDIDNAFAGWGGEMAGSFALVSTQRKSSIKQIFANPIKSVQQENATSYVDMLFYRSLPDDQKPTPAEKVAIYTYGLLSALTDRSSAPAISDEQLKEFIEIRLITDLRAPISPEFQFEALDSLDLRRKGQRFREIFHKYPDLWRSFMEALLLATERNISDEVTFISGLTYSLQYTIAKGVYPEIPEDLKEKFAPLIEIYARERDLPL